MGMGHSIQVDNDDSFFGSNQTFHGHGHGSTVAPRFPDDPVDDIFDILCQRVTAAPETDLDPLSTPRTVSLSTSGDLSPVADDQHNSGWWQSIVSSAPYVIPSHSPSPTDYPSAKYIGTKMEEFSADDPIEFTAQGTCSIVSQEQSFQQSSSSSSDESSAAEFSPPPTPPVNAHPDLPPLRALSAYNFFFRDERERLLYGGELCLDSAKCNALLTQHWSRDRTQKRRHRKTHGKIPFTELSKIVSRKWKGLDDQQKNFYRRVSSLDWERYQKELEDFKNRQLKQEDEEDEDDEASDSDMPATKEESHEEEDEEMKRSEIQGSGKSNGDLASCGSFYSSSIVNPTEI